MDKLKKLFKNKKLFVIGMVHTAPLLGYKNSPGFKEVEKKFMQDLKFLVAGGIDAVMIENNYDIPHFETAKPSTIPQLTDLCLKARKFTKKPLGLCVLWNDYKTALSIAKIANFNFVRVPVFVDRVKTHYGIFSGKAKEAIEFRKKIDAENILIFADIQVKHAEHLIKRSLNDAVREAVAKTAENIPVILGSGITLENVKKYDVDGLIVGSYFKGESNSKERDFHNIFPWKVKMQKERVKKFMQGLSR